WLRARHRRDARSPVAHARRERRRRPDGRRDRRRRGRVSDAEVTRRLNVRPIRSSNVRSTRRALWHVDDFRSVTRIQTRPPPHHARYRDGCSARGARCASLPYPDAVRIPPLLSSGGVAGRMRSWLRIALWIAGWTTVAEQTLAAQTRNRAGLTPKAVAQIDSVRKSVAQFADPRVAEDSDRKSTHL